MHWEKQVQVKTYLKYAVLIVVFVFLTITALSETTEASDKENRWKYICYDINQPDMKYYYDSETVSYISDNQVSVWMKIVTPGNNPQLLHLEIACASSMFHLLEDSVNTWGSRTKTSYIAGRWVMTPPDSEVYLLSKLVCKDLKSAK
jgi:hypothetical protein